MENLITILIIILCILLVLVILIQNPKGGGLSSTFGAANQFGGIKQTMDKIEKLTWGLAIAIVLLSMISSTMSTTQVVKKQNRGVEKRTGQ